MVVGADVGAWGHLFEPPVMFFPNTRCNHSNTRTTVEWLDRAGYDSFLIHERGGMVQLSGGCWTHDYETWMWSNVVSVSRRHRPALAARFAARPVKDDASTWSCEAAVALDDDAAATEPGGSRRLLLLRAPHSADQTDWHAAAEDFALRNGMSSGGGCDNVACISGVLTELLYLTCAGGAH